MDIPECSDTNMWRLHFDTNKIWDKTEIIALAIRNSYINTCNALTVLLLNITALAILNEKAVKDVIKFLKFTFF